MPIYGFQCAECGHSFDRLQKLSDPDPTDCPACQQPAIRRQITAPSFRLAGGGWYETDFGANKRNLADSGNAAPKAAESATATAPATPAKTSGNAAG